MHFHLGRCSPPRDGWEGTSCHPDWSHRPSEEHPTRHSCPRGATAFMVGIQGSGAPDHHQHRPRIPPQPVPPGSRAPTTLPEVSPVTLASWQGLMLESRAVGAGSPQGALLGEFTFQRSFLLVMMGFRALGLLFFFFFSRSVCVCLWQLYWDVISQGSMVFVKIASKKNQNKMVGMMLAAQPWTKVCPGFSHPLCLLGPSQGSVWHGDRQTDKGCRKLSACRRRARQCP